MWNNPRLLNLAANVLFALAFAAGAWGAAQFLMRSAAFPLRTLSVEGELRHVVRADVVRALQGRLSGTFFTVDLESVRGVFEGIPWVRRAQVRRQWPDRIEVKLEEQVTLARWGQDGRLVNTYGEIFAGRTDAQVPLFAGPAGSEGEITHRYGTLREQFAPLALEPRQVLLSPRYSWQVKLSNGLTLQLGRESEKDGIEARLARFVSVYPQTLGRLARRLDYADLRYPNGFALRLPEIPAAGAGKRGRA